MDKVYYIGIQDFDAYDKSVIEKYIKDSSNDKERYKQIYKEVVGNVESVLRGLCSEVSDAVRLGYLKKIVWNWNMRMTDKDCLVAIFLNHYPAFHITEKNSTPINQLKNPLCSHFTTLDSKKFSMEIAWNVSNPFGVQHNIQKKIPDRETAALKKIEAFWEDALKGQNTDLQIVCQGKTFHAHASFLKGMPLVFQKANEGISKEVFEHMLKFAYFGSLANLNKASHSDLLFEIHSLASNSKWNDLAQNAKDLINSKPSPNPSDKSLKRIEVFWNDALAGKNTDLQVICQDKTYYVNALFLKTVPYFQVMFTSVEGDEVELSEISKDVFEQILHFAYFGSLVNLKEENQFDLLIEVFSQARKFMDDDLQKYLLKLIEDQLLSPSNPDKKALALLHTGMKYENQELIDYGLRVLNLLELKTFYAVVAGNFQLDAIDKLIVHANSLKKQDLASKLENISIILKAHANLI